MIMKYTAFLRGINVGGKNKIKMETLREMFAVQKREIFCLLRVSVLNSLVGKDYIAKKLKIPSTARNWRTVNKVLEF